MFNIRRSMNPPRKSTTSAADAPPVPQLPPPTLPPGLTHSPSESGSSPQVHNQQKSNPYQHHYQQSQSKVRPTTATLKYPPPIENKAQSPKRHGTSSGLLGRVSSFFGSPSSPGGSGSTNKMKQVPENETGAEGRDDRSVTPSTRSKRTGLVAMLTKSNSKSESISKPKRVPPPLTVVDYPRTGTPPATGNTTANSIPSSFSRFRSLTRSRSKVAKQLFGPVAAINGPIEHKLDPRLQPPLTPRTPRSPRSPRDPLSYDGSSDGESDIRRPSGLGPCVSHNSGPQSPFGARYPWEMRHDLCIDLEGETMRNGTDDSHPTDESSMGMMKEAFRFPNRSAINLSVVVECDSPDPDPVRPRTAGRPRSMSTPGLFPSIERKLREKLEREKELEKLKFELLNVQKLNEVAKSEESSQCHEDQDVAYEAETENVLDGGDELQQDLQQRLSLYTSDGDSQRVPSFSIVNMFPEPPTTHPSRHPSESSPTAFFLSLPPPPPPPPVLLPVQVPLVLPFPEPGPASPIPSIPTEYMSSAPKRTSSATMNSMVTTDTTLTMTSSSMSDVGELTEETIRHLRLEMGGAPLTCFDYLHLASLPPPPNINETAGGTPSCSAPVTRLPHEVLSLALSFLPSKKDVAPLAQVNKAYAAVVKGLLYDTIDLDALVEENVGASSRRVKKLLATLVKTKELTGLVTKFVCRTWPEWFPDSPYGPSLDQEADEVVELEEETVLQNTFLASTLVLVVSRMTKLKDLVVPSCHPLFFSEMGPRIRWTGLKTVEFGNVMLGDEEAREMFEWLAGMTSVEKLSFPRLAEKVEVSIKTSNDSIKTAPVQHSKKSVTSVQKKRYSVPTNRHPRGAGGRADLTGSLMTPISLCFSATENETDEEDPLAEYAHSSTFLPNLKALHAPPGILSVFTTSAPAEQSAREEEEEESAREPWRRPLEDVTINIDRTLYNGLRPKALVQGLQGLKRFGLRCGKKVDRRTLEKVLIAAGSVLGNSLEGLEVEFAGEGGLAAGTDESLYKIINAVLPRYPNLRQLKLWYSETETASMVGSAAELEQARLSQWMKHCAKLERVGWLSGSSWSRTAVVV